jgi:hypothetical protein
MPGVREGLFTDQWELREAERFHLLFPGDHPHHSLARCVGVGHSELGEDLVPDHGNLGPHPDRVCDADN